MHSNQLFNIRNINLTYLQFQLHLTGCRLLLGDISKPKTQAFGGLPFIIYNNDLNYNINYPLGIIPVSSYFLLRLVLSFWRFSRGFWNMWKRITCVPATPRTQGGDSQRFNVPIRDGQTQLDLPNFAQGH